MEFLQNTSTEEEDDDEDDESFVTAPLPPVLPPIAVETLPLRYDHGQREGLASAVALGGRVSATLDHVLEDYYTLKLRGTYQPNKTNPNQPHPTPTQQTPPQP